MPLQVFFVTRQTKLIKSNFSDGGVYTVGDVEGMICLNGHKKKTILLQLIFLQREDRLFSFCCFLFVCFVLFF